MNLDFLRLFVRVAELGSLTKAAAALDTVQPVISRSISSLEREVGGRLFHRTGRGVELSSLGKMLLPRARALIADADTFVADAHAFTNVPSGMVRIGMLASFSYALVPMLLARVRQELPDVRFRVFIGTIGRIDEWLEEGKIDISLNFRDGSTPLGDARCIGSVDSYLVGRPDDPLLERATIDFAELDDLPLILSATPSGLRARLSELAAAHKINLNAVVEVDSFPLHLKLAMDGFGYAILTPQAIQEIRPGAGMGAARIVRPRIVRSLTLGTSTRSAPSLATRTVADLIAGLGQEMLAAGLWQKVPLAPGAELEPTNPR